MIANRGEMASILGVSEPTLDTLRRKGMPGEKVGTKWEFDTRKVIAWMVKEGSRDSPRAKKDAVDLRTSLAEAEIKEFKVAELRGTMLHIDDVTPIVEEQFIVIKSKITALPARLAQKCAVEDDPATVLRIIKAEVAEVLEDISSAKVKDPDRKTHGFVGPDDEPEPAKPWEEDGL